MKLGLMFGAALACVAVPASAQNLIGNGSFEQGFDGWAIGNVGGGTPPVTIQYGQAGAYPTGAFGEAVPMSNAVSRSPDAVGSRFAYFSSDTANPDTLSQIVNLVAGRTYDVGFDYYVPRNGYDNPNDATLSFLVGNANVATLRAGQPAGTPPATWLNFSRSFVATTTGQTNLSFQFRGLGSTAADFAVDRVYLSAAVPEPATWAMMIVGFGAVGGSLRHRRLTARVAAA